MSRRLLLSGLAAIGVAFFVLASCASSGDYEGGGRRTVPPGATDGSIGVTPVDATEPQDTSPPPPDTSAPDTNPFRPDTGPG